MGAAAILTGIFISDAGSSGRDWGAEPGTTFFEAEQPAKKISVSGKKRLFGEGIFIRELEMIFIKITNIIFRSVRRKLLVRFIPLTRFLTAHSPG